MIMEDSSGYSIGPLQRRKALFNRPSWSKPQVLIGGTNLFHRSTQTYIDHATEAERQRKKKLSKKAIEQAQRVENRRCAGKRQRVSEDEDDDDSPSGEDEEGSLCSQTEDESQASNSSLTHLRQAAHVAAPQKSENPGSLLSKSVDINAATKRSKPSPGKCNRASHIVDLEDITGGLDESLDRKVEPSNLAAPPISIDDPISDEEFPELAHQARERARRNRLEEDVSTAALEPLTASQNTCLNRSQITHQATPPSLSPILDPVLQIFITSKIASTTPLIVNRKLSQRLKDVRLAWVERQQFSPDFADKIFLTWRGKRLFDVTSCRSLGISAGPNGRILAKGDNVVDHEGRIHMEAMTTELLNFYKEARSHDSLNEEEDQNMAPVEAQRTKEAQIKIICKAKGYADFKLIVKPSTMVSKICNAFRLQFKIDDDKEVYLMFDGEKLSDHDRIQNTELSDMDALDVVVR